PRTGFLELGFVVEMAWTGRTRRSCRVDALAAAADFDRGRGVDPGDALLLVETGDKRRSDFWQRAAARISSERGLSAGDFSCAAVVVAQPESRSRRRCACLSVCDPRGACLAVRAEPVARANAFLGLQRAPKCDIGRLSDRGRRLEAFWIACDLEHRIPSSWIEHD